MTTDDQLFVTLLHRTFDGREFTAADVVDRVYVDNLPGHVARELLRPSTPPKNPARLLGRWLVNRVGVVSLADGSALLHRTRKLSNVQRWRVSGVQDPLPGAEPPNTGETLTVWIGG